MKKILLIIILLFFVQLTAEAQHLGTYCFSTGFTGECITFLKDKKFYYSYSSCTSSEDGFGSYTVEGDELVLKFETDTFHVCKPFVEQKIATGTNTVSIDIHAADLEKEGLAFANVIVMDQDGFMIKGEVMDMDGNCRLTLPKDSNSYTLTVNYIGLSKPYKFTTDSNYKIIACLDLNEANRIHAPTTMTYKIKRLKRNQIVIKHQYTERFVTYEKRGKSLRF